MTIKNLFLFFLILPTLLIAQNKSNDSLKTLDTIKVTAKEESRILKNKGKISEIEITAKDVLLLPATGQADISRAIQLLPGISAANESASGLVVRGSSSEENLILFDEYTLYYVDHFFGFYSPFNIDAIEKVSVLKGGFGASYGSRSSAILDFSGKVADYNKFHIGGQLGLLSGNIYTEIPMKKASLFFAARRSYSDVIQSSIY